MTLEELERGVDGLPRRDLKRFAEWFETYWEGAMSSERKTTKGQEDELIRRRDEYIANPSSASDWDDGFLDRFKQILDRRGNLPSTN